MLEAAQRVYGNDCMFGVDGAIVIEGQDEPVATYTEPLTFPVGQQEEYSLEGPGESLAGSPRRQQTRRRNRAMLMADLSELPQAQQLAAILTAAPAAITSAYNTIRARRPRSSAERCPCGENTLTRARKRWPSGLFVCCMSLADRVRSPKAPTMPAFLDELITAPDGSKQPRAQVIAAINPHLDAASLPVQYERVYRYFYPEHAPELEKLVHHEPTPADETPSKKKGKKQGTI